MALELSKDTVLSTDKRYYFLENKEGESNGYDEKDGFICLFEEYRENALLYALGEDEDPRYFLVPATLLTFNTKSEN